jgi:murein DD-endopeptidase MepM/ murein hydrolase activator NlpD
VNTSASSPCRPIAFALALASVTALVAVPAAAASIERTATAQITALHVTTTGTPHRVHGSDGREHIEFNLVITNSFTSEVSLESLVVRGGGKELLTLSGDALGEFTHPFGAGPPTATIPPSSTVKTLVDVVMPRSARRTVPKRIKSRIAYAFPPGSPSEAVIGSKVVRGPALRVDRRVPIEIAPPLRGDGWLSANGCCDDPTVPHRSTIVSVNGSYTAIETFAVDYIRIVDGRFYAGDGTQNADWFGYGVPIHSVADGKVVSAVDGRPEVPPFIVDNRTLSKPSDFCGNGVVVRIAPRQFASYCHLQPGSIRVEVGDRVRTGAKLGLFGNSGNTDGPHLHFGINSGPDTLTSDSLPFEIDRYRFEGTATGGSAPGEASVSGEPRGERRSHPLVGSVSDYSR